MEKKLTKKMVIDMLLKEEVILANEIYVNYLTNERNLLDKKGSKGGSKKGQLENEEIKEMLFNVLDSQRTSEGYPKFLTITEMLDIEEIANYEVKNGDNKKLTSQKIRPLLTQLIDEGKVENLKDKKKSTFAVKED